MKTSYMLCSNQHDGYAVLASDGNFYGATISIRGCHTLIYKRVHAALKRLNKAVSPRLYPNAGVLSVTHYKQNDEEKVLMNWFHRDGTFKTIFAD